MGCVCVRERCVCMCVWCGCVQMCVHHSVCGSQKTTFRTMLSPTMSSGWTRVFRLAQWMLYPLSHLASLCSFTFSDSRFSFSFCCCDKIFWQGNSWEKGLILAHGPVLQSVTMGKLRSQGWSSCSLWIHSQKRAASANLCSTYIVHTHSPGPNCNKEVPSPLPSVNTVETVPHRYSKAYHPGALECAKSTMNTSHDSTFLVSFNCLILVFKTTFDVYVCDEFTFSFYYC